MHLYVNLHVYTYTYTHRNIDRERQRERERANIHICCVYVHMYMYIYTYTRIHVSRHDAMLSFWHLLMHGLNYGRYGRCGRYVRYVQYGQNVRYVHLYIVLNTEYTKYTEDGVKHYRLLIKQSYLKTGRRCSKQEARAARLLP